MDRRAFLTATSTTLALSSVAAAATSRKARVGVIGHTGRGNYGHGLDTVWLHVPEATVIGVADPDESGLAQAMKRLGTEDGFADYRAMLEAVKPEVVAICPRHPDQRRDMIIASIEAGAKGVYVEKPFCRTPAEADDVIAVAEEHRAKIAIAHRNRYHPTLRVIDKLMADGELGKVLEIRGRGKGDQRGGGEDLWVLGSHTLNLINYFGGKPLTCSAVMKQDGRRVTGADVKQGNEALGPLAGNEVHARYEMERGMIAYFDSIANDETRNQGFGLQIIGSKGIVAMRCDLHPLAHFVPGNPFEPTDKPRPWIPISSAGVGQPEPCTDLEEMISHHGSPARDLLTSMGTERQPLCNAYEGRTIVEMICGVFVSHRQEGAAVEFPLKERGNALATR
ncbi:Gfo/Idh/MocA family protein [Novipirellula artificiosorum]|uniref:Putative oxidoreductase n=1 Tax=Novipirellula artificiosorum TaxID=2528016 RepID=A0A5C6D5R7_9BACT|nr:Gfo/Idh/MocA family oxidoreductase [Novipirellula artificiosorum]TWU32493.1 putative oxidoreductase [Novipirellula artificiosorum]